MKRSTNLELFNNKKKILKIENPDNIFCNENYPTCEGIKKKLLKIENPDNIFCNENYPTCEGIKKEYDKNIVKFLKSLNLNL